MAISAKDAVKQYKIELLTELPLDEAIFFAMAEKAALFPLSTGNSIKAEKTRADKVAYFLQHVVEPAAETYLPKLLEVMKKSKVLNIEKLARDIQATVEPGIYSVWVCVCTYVCDWACKNQPWEHRLHGVIFLLIFSIQNIVYHLHQL